MYIFLKKANDKIKVQSLRTEMDCYDKENGLVKNTGDINTFLELKQIEDIEKDVHGKVEENGKCKTEWDSDCRE